MIYCMSQVLDYTSLAHSLLSEIVITHSTTVLVMSTAPTVVPFSAACSIGMISEVSILGYIN
jgi:hypothetical protein